MFKWACGSRFTRRGPEGALTKPVHANYAINGYVAFDIARSFRPDIILLDLGLPGPNGFDVCERIKADADLRHARVIVITGYANDEFRVRSQKAGCEMHLVKPVPASVIEHLLG